MYLQSTYTYIQYTYICICIYIYIYIYTYILTPDASFRNRRGPPPQFVLQMVIVQAIVMRLCYVVS